MKAVIMAGGQGTRLWPLSRRRNPKQFLSLLSEAPMIADCYGRLRQLFAAPDIYVACMPDFADQVRQCLPELANDHLLLEPARRDSGPAMALAALHLKRRGVGAEPVVFIPTDHAIGNVAVFLQTIAAGLSLIAKQPGFVDIGIAPTEALNTLGYTQIGEQLGQENNVPYYRFLGHVEKPDTATAQKLIDSGDYLWHASYYMATPDLILAAFQQYSPEIAAVIAAYEPESPAWAQSYSALRPISFDFAVTEHLPADAMRILRGDFGWNDVGQFAQLRDWLSGNKKNATVAKGQHIALDSHGCLVVGGFDKMIAIIGVKDLAIIDTPDALLVCDLARAADIKRLVEELGKAGKDHLL